MARQKDLNNVEDALGPVQPRQEGRRVRGPTAFLEEVRMLRVRNLPAARRFIQVAHLKGRLKVA